MALPSKNFAAFVGDMVAAWAAQLGFQPTLQKGDALYATMQAVCSQLVFLQSQVALVNAVARASTCGSDLNNGTTDADLDAFYADFNFPRLPGVASQGAVTFTKLVAATSQILISPGAIVQTVGGAIQYTVIADAGQPTWNATLGAYVLAIGQTSLAATVQAAAVGSQYNVTAGQLSQMATAIPGIDQVSNPGAIANGVNAEGNAAYRARFVLFINSLSKATYGAIVSAIEGVGFGLTVPGLVSLVENVDLALAARPGEFIATVDDGTGSPSATLVGLVQAAIDNVRGFTILGLAHAVTKITPTITISVRAAPGYITAVVEDAVQTAVLGAVNGTPVGGVDGVLLYISEIEGAALATPGCLSVQPGQTKINGSNADLAGTQFQATRCLLSNITVGSY